MKLKPQDIEIQNIDHLGIVALSTSHLDSSSMHVHGQYNTSLPEVIFESQKIVNNQELEEIAVKSLKEITITYGYSRDHRPDLKQFIIEMK